MAERIKAQFSLGVGEQAEAARMEQVATAVHGSRRLGRETILALLDDDVRWSKVIRLRTAVQSGCYRVSSRKLADRLLPILFVNA